MGETFTAKFKVSILRPRLHKTFNSAESRAETGTKARLKSELFHIVVGNEPVLCNSLKMDPTAAQNSKGKFVKAFPEVGLNGRKVRGQHKEQSALTSSDKCSSEGCNVRSGRSATGRDRRLLS